METSNTTRNLAKLPPLCYVSNTLHMAGPQGEPPVIAVKRGEMGYYPIYTNLTAEELNVRLGVTPQQASAMLNGSMFGWDSPATDPDNEVNK